MTEAFRGFIAILLIVSSAGIAGAETISNTQFAITWDHGHYTMRVNSQSTPFASGTKVNGAAGKAMVTSVRDPDFGFGKAIEVSFDDGSSEHFEIFEQLPFVLWRAIIVNGGITVNGVKEAVILNRVPWLRTDLDLGYPAAGLVTLGTGGLEPPDKNPGSYAWLAVAEPKSRSGVVAGWLTHEHASGAIFTKVDGDRVSLEARGEYGRLKIAPGRSAESETFALGWFPDARPGLESWADAVAKRLQIHLPPQPVVYCTWYDNVHGGSGKAVTLAELSAFAAKELKPFGFSCVQIDDGWQLGNPKGNGPKKNFSGFDPKGPYPDGMKPTAADIQSKGLTAGLWLLPFGGTWNDPFFQPHQDWFVRRADDGKPFDTAWGGTALDMTEPGARWFVSNEVSQAVHEWGYHYLKIDGLSTGCGVKPQYVNTGWKEDDLGNGIFHDPDKSNIDVFRSGLRLIRAAAGPGAFILGCCAAQNMRSYAGSFGLVDAMRTGPDNGGSWDNWFKNSPMYGSRNNHLNGRIWWNDPDPIYVRTSIPLESARCIASWNAIAGHMISLSDWLPALPPDRLDIIKRVIPGHHATSRPVDLFSSQPPRIWLATDERAGQQRRDVLGLFNWGENDATMNVGVDELGLPPAKEYTAFDFWNNSLVPAFTNSLTLPVVGHGCRVLAIHPLLPHPFLLSTSRHVSQGILEVRDERWNDKTKTLSGVSKVVANDPYELRIVAMAPDKAWSVADIQITTQDHAAAAFRANFRDGLFRLALKPSASGDMTWRIRFKSESREDRKS